MHEVRTTLLLTCYHLLHSWFSTSFRHTGGIMVVLSTFYCAWKHLIRSQHLQLACSPGGMNGFISWLHYVVKLQYRCTQIYTDVHWWIMQCKKMTSCSGLTSNPTFLLVKFGDPPVVTLASILQGSLRLLTTHVFVNQLNTASHRPA